MKQIRKLINYNQIINNQQLEVLELQMMLF